VGEQRGGVRSFGQLRLPRLDGGEQLVEDVVGGTIRSSRRSASPASGSLARPPPARGEKGEVVDPRVVGEFRWNAVATTGPSRTATGRPSTVASVSTPSPTSSMSGARMNTAWNGSSSPVIGTFALEGVFLSAERVAVDGDVYEPERVDPVVLRVPRTDDEDPRRWRVRAFRSRRARGSPRRSPLGESAARWSSTPRPA